MSDKPWNDRRHLTYEIENELGAELQRQIDKFGYKTNETCDPLKWLAILGEEYGEVSKEVVEMTFCGRDTENYQKELIQVAAVAIAALKCLRGVQT